MSISKSLLALLAESSLSSQCDGFGLFLFVPAVLAVLPALPGYQVQPRTLKQAGHEG